MEDKDIYDLFIKATDYKLSTNDDGILFDVTRSVGTLDWLENSEAKHIHEINIDGKLINIRNHGFSVSGFYDWFYFSYEDIRIKSKYNIITIQIYLLYDIILYKTPLYTTRKVERRIDKIRYLKKKL